MRRALRLVAGTLAGVVLVFYALVVAYGFGGGWGAIHGWYAPTPLNVVGALSIVWAAVHASYVLAVPRARRQPFSPPSRVMTVMGVALLATGALAAALSRV